jgi:hypothetical protein
MDLGKVEAAAVSNGLEADLIMCELKEVSAVPATHKSVLLRLVIVRSNLEADLIMCDTSL